MTNRIDRNPLTGEVTLMAPNRLDRPNALLDRADEGSCPFCRGNEHETPPEIERIEHDGQWIVRVVPNKFPVASPGSGIDGLHEVIIESPDHEDELRTISPEHRRSIVDIWMSRIEHARDARGVDTVLLFRNRGPHAGESIRHPHSQLLGIPFVPDRIESQRVGDHPCVLCSLGVALEIARCGSLSIHAAPAARFPHQIWIVDSTHRPHPDLDSSGRDDLASAIGLAESLLQAALGEHSANWIVVQAPRGINDFHWYVEISPRITGIAGFELATGSSINPIPPEESARILRKAIENV